MSIWKRFLRTVARKVWDAIVPPQARLLQKLGGMNLALAIKAALELGIFHALAEKSLSAGELAESLELNRAALRRLLRALVAAGLLREDAHGRYTATAVGAVLQEGAPDISITPLARYVVSDELILPLLELGYSIRTGAPSFDHIMGTDWYAYGKARPEHLALMDAAMEAYSRLSLPALLKLYSFARFKTIVDVAGGTGHVLAAILQAVPDARGILFDQPATIARTAHLFDRLGLGARCELIGGDMFRAVPTGGDLYILNKALNDWDDEHALCVLRRVRAAMTLDARLIIIEMLGSEESPSLHEGLRDLALLAYTGGGRTRTEGDFRELLQRASLSLSRVTPMKGPFLVSGLVPVGPAFTILSARPVELLESRQAAGEEAVPWELRAYDSVAPVADPGSLPALEAPTS